MNEHFYMPKKHRNSIIVMLVLVVLLNSISLYFSRNNDEVFIKENRVENEKSNSTEVVTELPTSSFNPNVATKEVLIAQGLSEYAANNLIKLRSTGWRVKYPEELRKVYGIDSIIYDRIKDRIDLPGIDTPKKIERSKPKLTQALKERSPFDPNLASYEELLNQGFTKYAANNLRRYLEKGGRIQSKEDLRKIYGIDEALYLEISNRIVLGASEGTLVADTVIVRQNEIVILDDFDPNTASLEELVNQGFDRKTAYSLIRYREKGGIIKEKTQLRKIYGMSDSLFTSLESRIRIPLDSITQVENFNIKDSGEVNIPAPDTTVYNLNTITQEELLNIKGIGPYYSKAIVEYRTKLGGYYAVEQLLEVPAFKEEHYKELEGRFKVDGNVSRISPVAEFKVLLRHPYIDYELAKKFKSMSVFDMEDRIQEMISTGQIEERLIPYLQQY